MQESPIKNWHNLNKEEVAEILGTDLEMGLTKEESLKRRKQWGLNVITKKKEQHVFVQFLLQFHQPLIYILILAAAFTFYLKEYIDSLVIFAVVLINAIVGFVQESKAKKAIDALAKELKTECNLIRNGKKMKVDAEKLVAGDVVLLKSGDRIPADMRFFQVNDLKVDESALTGESVAVEKTVEITESNAVLGDRYNMGYATSIVTYGTGKGVVTATGDASEVGKISGSIADAVEIKTPLTKKNSPL